VSDPQEAARHTRVLADGRAASVSLRGAPESRCADRMAQEGFQFRRVLGAEPGRWNIACDSPCPSESVELVSHSERMFTLAVVVKGAPVGVLEPQTVFEHRRFIG
jgi:hypothetical protein